VREGVQSRDIPLTQKHGYEYRTRWLDNQVEASTAVDYFLFLLPGRYEEEEKSNRTGMNVSMIEED